MRVIWEECKYIFRGRFLWAVLALGLLYSLGISMMNQQWVMENSALTNRYVEEHGAVYDRSDGRIYEEYYLRETEEGRRAVEIMKELGYSQPTEADFLEVYEMFNTNYEACIAKLGEETFWELQVVLQQFGMVFHEYFSDIVPKVDGKQAAEDGIYHLENYGSMETAKLPQWKKDLLFWGGEQLEARYADVDLEKERNWLVPAFQISSGFEWLNSLTNSNYGMGFLMAVGMVLAGMVAARSLGGSFLEGRENLLYSTKSGRKLVFSKLAASLLAVSVLYLLLTAIFLAVMAPAFRVDLYWDVPIIAGAGIIRFPTTVGGYLLFLVGVGLGCTVVMCLLFCGFMIGAKNFFGGSALCVGVSLVLAAVILFLPAVQTSLFLMGSPIGLFTGSSRLLGSDFPFSFLLPHFEGISLLIWGLLASLVVGAGFLRFRKAAL